MTTSRTILIGWVLHARFSSFVDVTKEKFQSQSGITCFRPGLAEREKLQSYPGKMWSLRLPGPKERKLCVGQATHTKKTQLQQKREPSPRKKTGLWSSQHGQEMKTEIISKGVQSNIFANFRFGKQTSSRATLTKWQRLANFCRESVTSLEKLKISAKT